MSVTLVGLEWMLGVCRLMLVGSVLIVCACCI
jgi:hypothetical protein